MTLYLSQYATPHPREAKLPVWARGVLESLRRDRESLEADLKAIQQFDEDEPIRLLGGQHKQSFPQGYSVSFNIGNGESIHVEPTDDGEGVHVRQFGGRHNLSVRPSANNAIIVRSADS